MGKVVNLIPKINSFSFSQNKQPLGDYYAKIGAYPKLFFLFNIFFSYKQHKHKKTQAGSGSLSKKEKDQLRGLSRETSYHRCHLIKKKEFERQIRRYHDMTNNFRTGLLLLTQ